MKRPYPPAALRGCSAKSITVPSAKPAQSPAEPSHEASGPAVFWALVPLALNAMVQPTGAPARIPEGYAMILRLSPFACLVDSLGALMLLVRYYVHGCSLRAAAIKVMDWRFENQVSATHAASSKDLWSFLKHPWLRFFLLVAGALPQTVKLYAMRGIPWTQAFASMYLATFVIFELLAHMCRGDNRGSPHHHHNSFRPVTISLLTGHLWRGAMSVQYGAVVMIFCSICMGSDSASHEYSLFKLPKGYFHPMFSYLTLGGFLCLLVELGVIERDSHDFLPSIAELIAVPAFVFPFRVHKNLSDESRGPVGTTIPLALLFGVTIRGIVKTVIMHCYPAFRRPYHWPLLCFALFFSSVTLLTVSAYHFHSWDSRGTFKPQWADYLG